jgi:hypothetical protein
MQHEFVDCIPDKLEEGVLYISLSYATAVHKCACGCGHEVVTPFSPTDWSMQFNGETVSLDPSIGNWSFPCRSHYLIKRDRVVWVPSMSREEIDAGRASDQRAKQRQFGQIETKSAPSPEKGKWRQFVDWFLS